MRYRYVFLCAEWKNWEDIRAIRVFLTGNGACHLYADEDMDQQYIRSQSFSHSHPVFKFCINHATPVYELISALAAQPGVYAAGEI